MATTVSNILATVFFALAFLWFVVAVWYAASVILFLKMRREGRFTNVRFSDPEFGRFYFCGGRLYLPMGWIFRRFILQYQSEQERRSNNGKVMNKTERRQAMEYLLCDRKVVPPKTTKSKKVDTSADTSSSSESETDEEHGCLDTTLEEVSDSSDVENVCSICLGAYTSENSAWLSPVCNHQFHRNCLLAWLEQPGKIDCPCCRKPFVEEDAVWKAVKQLRKKRKPTRGSDESSPSKNTVKTEPPADLEDDIEAPSIPLDNN